MPSHSIRLRGPWEFTATVAGQSVERTLRLPGAWPEEWHDQRMTKVRLARWFHTPTGIEQAHAILITLDSPSVGGVALLNDAELGRFQPDESAAWEVTSRMLRRNRLVLALDQMPHQRWEGEVRLVIQQAGDR